MTSLTVSPTNLTGANTGLPTTSDPVCCSLEVSFNPDDPYHDPYRQSIPNDKHDAENFVLSQTRTKSNLVRMTIKGNPKKGEEDTPVDVDVVLDVSGSMNERVQYNDGERTISKQRIQIAKMVLETLFEALSPKDSVSLTAFNYVAKNVFPSTKMTKENLKNVLVKNKSIKAGGGTNMASALLPLLKAINDNEKRTENPEETKTSKNILLISDGNVNRGLGSGGNTDDLVKAIKNIAPGTITLYVIGIGAGVNENLLKQISTALGGQYYHTNGDPDSMASIVGANVLGGSRGTIASQVRVEVRSDKGTIKPLYNGPFTVKVTERGFVCTLPGELQEEEEKSLIFTKSDEDDMILSATYTALNFSTCKFEEGVASVVSHSVVPQWFVFTFSSLIENVVEQMDNDYDEGKEEAETVMGYLLALEKKYPSIGAERIADVKTQVQNLIDTPDQSSYECRARKSAVAATTSFNSMRSVTTGGACKSLATVAFSRSVRGKGSGSEW